MLVGDWKPLGGLLGGLLRASCGPFGHLGADSGSLRGRFRGLRRVFEDLLGLAGVVGGSCGLNLQASWGLLGPPAASWAWASCSLLMASPGPPGPWADGVITSCASGRSTSLRANLFGLAVPHSTLAAQSGEHFAEVTKRAIPTEMSPTLRCSWPWRVVVVTRSPLATLSHVSLLGPSALGMPRALMFETGCLASRPACKIRHVLSSMRVVTEASGLKHISHLLQHTFELPLHEVLPIRCMAFSACIILADALGSSTAPSTYAACPLRRSTVVLPLVDPSILGVQGKLNGSAPGGRWSRGHHLQCPFTGWCARADWAY